MGRTDKFRRLLRLVRTALSEHQSTSPPVRRRTITRREFVAVTGGAAAALGTAAARAATSQNLDVGIVGAGLAGLVCAEQLTRKGVTPAIYDAAHVSAAGVFPCAASSLARWRSAAVSSSTIPTRHCSGTRGRSGSLVRMSTRPRATSRIFSVVSTFRNRQSSRNSARSFLRCVTTSGTRQEVPRQTRTTPRT